MFCTHLSQIRPVQPSGHGCEECLEQGSSWVELRLCLTCGHVGCCNSSPGRHAQKHFEASGHPIVRSYSSGQDWSWCYPDGLYVDSESVDQAVEASLRHASRVRALESFRRHPFTRHA